MHNLQRSMMDFPSCARCALPSGVLGALTIYLARRLTPTTPAYWSTSVLRVTRGPGRCWSAPTESAQDVR